MGHMQWLFTKNSARAGLWIAALGLASLLILLGVLQYHWVNQISQAEAQRQHRQLHIAAMRISGDIGQSLRQLTTSLPAVARPYLKAFRSRPTPPARLGRALTSALPAGVLQRFILTWPHAGGPPQLFVWKGMTGPWRRWRFGVISGPGHRPIRKTRALMFSDFGPIRVGVLQTLTRLRRRPPQPPRPGMTAGIAAPVFLMTDMRLSYVKQLLPAVLRGELGIHWRSEYRIWIGSPNVKADWMRVGMMPAWYGPATVRYVLLRPAPLFWGVHLMMSQLRRPRRRWQRPVPGGYWSAPGAINGVVLLVMQPRPNRLQALLAAGRRRNLFLGFGILAILAASLGLLAWEAGRARNLVRKQLDFVAGVTHELRTPLAVIASAADNLAEGVVRDDAGIRRYGAAIRDQGRRLTRMIEQVLEYAALKSGSTRLNIQAVTPCEVIAAVLRESQSAVKECAAEITVEAEPSLPSVAANQEVLESSLQNLLSNALKFSGPRPRIQMRARLDDEKARLRFEVADQGPGIEAGDQPHIFAPFYRGAQARARQIRGSGLGLHIVRQAIAGMGGKTGVRSTLGMGSVFWIELPVMAAPAGVSATSETN